MKKAQSEMRDRYAEITNQIIAAIEAGADPKAWRMPWHAVHETGLPSNRVTKRFYRGVNVMMLALAAQANGYPTGAWASYKQWASVGASVRKDEHGTVVCFYGSTVAKPEAEPSPEPGADVAGKTIRFLRFAHVFNQAQVDNPPPFTAPYPAGLAQPVARAERFAAASKAVIRHGRSRACYVPSQDLIEMPDRDAFTGRGAAGATENYYATLFHELVHWTGHARRLDRGVGLNRYGDEAYAMEELVAEIGSAYVNAGLALRPEPSPANAKYVASWLRVLKADSRAIFSAAGKASAAADYLDALAHPDTETDQEEEADGELH